MNIRNLKEKRNKIIKRMNVAFKEYDKRYCAFEKAKKNLSDVERQLIEIDAAILSGRMVCIR